MKKLLAILLVLTVLLTLCACENPLELLFPNTKGIKNKSADEAMKIVAENQKNVKSVRADGEMTVALSVMGLGFDIEIDYDIESASDPDALHMEMGLDMGAFGGYETEVYTVEDGDGYTTYVNSDGVWTKQAADKTEVEQNFTTILAVDDRGSYTEVGEEELNGVKTIHYTGTIDADGVVKALQSIGALGSLGIDGSDTPLDGIEDLSVDIWVSEESVLPVRYTMNLTNLMSVLLSGASEEIGTEMDVKEAILSFDLSDYDNVTVTVPQNVINEAA